LLGVKLAYCIAEENPECFGTCCYEIFVLIWTKTFEFLTKIEGWKTIILPLILYGCEAWSLIPKKQHRLRLFENRLLRRICGPKSDGVATGRTTGIRFLTGQ